MGAGLFGESLPNFENFWNSSFTDRLLVSDWPGWSIGATVFGVTLMALAMFYGAEKTEEFFRLKGTGKAWSWKISKRSYLLGAGALVAVAATVWFVGQPDPIRKWKIMENRYASQLTSRAVFIHPLEYVKTYNESTIKLVTLDLRPSRDLRNFISPARRTSSWRTCSMPRLPLRWRNFPRRESSCWWPMTSRWPSKRGNI